MSFHVLKRAFVYLFCVLFTAPFKKQLLLFLFPADIREISFGCGLSYRYLLVIHSLFSDSVAFLCFPGT